MKKALFFLFVLAWFFHPTLTTAQTCKAGTIKANHDTICADINDPRPGDTSFYPTLDTLFVTGSSDSIQWQEARPGGSFTNIKGASDSIYIEHIDSVFNTNLFRVIAHNGNLCADTSIVFALAIIPLYPVFFNYTSNYCTFHFTTDSVISVIRYIWDFGDSTTSILANPTHTYNTPIPPTVCLKGYYSLNCYYTFCSTLSGEDPCWEGIESISKENNYTIYPNLTNNIINFQSTGNTPGTIKLIDLLGRVKYETTYKPGDKLQISTANIPKGMYLLQVTEGNDVSTQRVVVQ